MIFRALMLCMAVVLPGAAAADDALCRAIEVREAKYVVCRFDAAVDTIRLYHADPDGKPYKHFNFLKKALADRGDMLLFAMNAGMYDDDRQPIGLYVENREQKKSLNTNDGPGNFHLKPNGVFWISDNRDGARAAYVASAESFQSGAHYVRDATQSGPMLVIDGEIHPKFRQDSTSKKRRNGVGVTADGKVFFVISDDPVTFHEFAALFRDELETPNALYLDGTISRLYAPELGRNDPGAAMGPIIGVSVHVN